MLVLARGQKEKNNKIFIGDNIVLKVLEIKGNTVRLGLEAPNDIRVLRGEITRNKEADYVR